MTRKTTTLWAVLLFLVGLAPRLHNLTYHSLWLDEALSVGWARLPVRAILPAGLGLVQDKHPPLYYLLLHGWIRLFGDGEVAVRGLSVLVGALAVPLGYLLVRHLCGHWAGLAAALLLAFNPFLVWYSQEVRMFGLATTLLLAASLCLVHALGRRGGEWWLAYILLAAASFYTYLFSALVLAAHGVYALVSLIRGTARTAGQTITLVLSFAAVGTLCAPLAWRAWQVGTGEAARGVPFGDLPGQLLSLLRAFALWKAPWAGPWVTPLLVVLGLLALWGLAAPAHCRRQKAERPAEASTPGVSPVHPAPARSETVGRCPSAFSLHPSAFIVASKPSFVAVFLIVPWILANLLLLADRTVFDEARYVIFLAPALCLALARPVGADRPAVRWSGVLASVLALGVFVGALGYDWAPAARREEWRATARYLEAHAGPGDVILVHADYVHKALLYYYHGPAQVTYPLTGAITSTKPLTPLLSEMAGHPAVWLVRSHWEVPDPQGLLDGWFAERYPLITELYPPGIILKGYATGYRSATLPADAARPDAVFGGELRLAGCRLDGTQFRAADDLFHPPSGWVHVTLYWQAVRPVTVTVQPVLRVTDDQGQIWGDRLDRANNALKMAPPAGWPTGETVRDDYDVNLNPITPAGRYRVELGLAGPDGRLLPVAQAGRTSDRVVCGEIEIVAR